MTDISKPPVTILREQASILTQATQRTLVGKVETNQTVAGRFEYTLSIVAPALGNYAYGVLYLVHDLDFYPVMVNDLGESPSPRSCANEEELLDALQSILSSARVHKAISSLLAQSKALA